MPALAYMTPAQWLLQYDANTIGDLCSDTGTPVTPAALATNPVALQMLSSASGHLQAACAVSGIYSVEDLNAIAGNDGDPGQSLLFEIIGQMAMVLAMRRRPEKLGSETLKQLREEVEQYLDLLRNGKRLFLVPDNTGNVTAGQVTVDGPTLATMQRVNGITIRTRNYYPSVAQRLPRGRA